MDLLYIIFSYNRPNILSKSLHSLFANGGAQPNEAWILDDGSDSQQRLSLVHFASQNSSNETPINVVACGKNYGIGWAFEQAYNILKWKNPKYCFFVESDYVFRKNAVSDCLALFEANPYLLAIPGTSHPDMYDRQKTHDLFPKLMMEQFPSDIPARDKMYIPFEIETKNGKMLVQGASNSCGCHILHWERTQQFFNDINRIDDFWRWMDRAFNKHSGGDRRNASDQHISCTLTWYWYEWAQKHNIDLTKNFPWIDICDYSIAQHCCGMGKNGMIVPEGYTFVGSPKWDEKYLEINPRNNTGQTL